MPKIETVAGVPSEAMAYSKLCDHLRDAADQAYTLGHIVKSQGSDPLHQTKGQGFLAIGELLEKVVAQVTTLATKGRLQ